MTRPSLAAAGPVAGPVEFGPAAAGAPVAGSSVPGLSVPGLSVVGLSAPGLSLPCLSAIVSPTPPSSVVCASEWGAPHRGQLPRMRLRNRLLRQTPAARARSARPPTDAAPTRRFWQGAARFWHNMQSRRSVAALCAAFLLGGVACVSPTRARTAPSYEEQFDKIWSEYDRIYPAFRYKNVSTQDWNDLRTRYRPRAAASRTEDEFISVMLDMLRPLRDVHAWFIDPKGVVVPTYVPTALENFDPARWARSLRDVGYVQHGRAWGEATIGGFAYIYIGTWGAQQIDTNALDLALNRYRDAPGMIIDVRMNAGGSDAAAFAFASRFAEKPVVVSYVSVRNGLSHDDLTPAQERTISPRGLFQYSKPVIVLAGRGGFSANESFVAAMRELPQVTVIGDTTGGASGNPKTVALGNGWRFTVPRWMEYAPDKQPIEWKGVAPNVAIPWTPREFYTEGDPLIDTAVGMLGERNGVFRVMPPSQIKH